MTLAQLPIRSLSGAGTNALAPKPRLPVDVGPEPHPPWLAPCESAELAVMEGGYGGRRHMNGRPRRFTWVNVNRFEDTVATGALPGLGFARSVSQAV